MKTAGAATAWLAVGPRAEAALLHLAPGADLGERGTLRATGQRLEAVQRLPAPAPRRVVRVSDVFTALAWLSTHTPQGCVVAAETITDRPADALRALRTGLRDAPLLVLDEAELPDVRRAAQDAGAALFPTEPAAQKLARALPDLAPPAPVLQDVDAAFPDRCMEHIDDPSALSRFVLATLLQVSGAQRITLLLRDPDRPTLCLEAGRGVNHALLGKVRCPVGRGIAGRVAALGRAVIGRGSVGGARDYAAAAYAVLPLGTPAACEGVACLTGLPGDQVPGSDTIARWLRITERAGRALSVARRLARAQAESTHCPLTLLPNRRAFQRALPRELERSLRAGTGLAVALFDVDHFKRCNDQYGHEAGDRVLVEIAQRMREALRETDLVARWGGEEFAVLLPDLDRDAPDEALAAAERARKRVAARPIALGAGLPPITVTVSGGLALHPAAGRDTASLLRAADRALFEAKDAGRNRIRRA